MEKKMRDFLWEGFDGNNLVSSDVVTKPKEAGGLGIGNLVIRNKALLGKWWWRFPKERDSLRAEVIESKYSLQDNGWDAGLATWSTFRSPWKFISRVYPMFLQLVTVQLGKGDKVRFWEDTWVGINL